MSGKETLTSLLGSFDNLSEPVPLSNKTPFILGLLISLQILAFTCAFLRLWTRLRIIKAPGWDDLFVLLSLIGTLAVTTITCLGASKYGLGKHALLLGTPQAIGTYLHGFYAGNGCYIMSTTFIKLALLLQYLRVLNRGRLFTFSVAVATLVGLWGIAYAALAWVPCMPVSSFWSASNPNANCWGFASQNPTSFRATFESHAAFNMAFDIVILCIPIILYFQMDLQRNMRLGLLGVLFLGTLANVVSVWRFASVLQHRAATWPTFDPTWYGCVSILLGAVEVDIAVVCASVPVFWPVLQSTGFQIFITREVKVTSESWLRSTDEAVKGIELGDSSLHRPESVRSKAGSEENLHMANSVYSTDITPLGLNEDSYGLSNVDPSGKSRWKQPVTRVSISADRGLVRL